MLSRVEEYNKYYSRNRWKGYAPMVERLIADFMKLYPKRTVLDLGCGVGNNVWYLSQVWKDSLFTGVDISDVAIGTARIKVPNATFIINSIEDVKLPNKYDIIFLIGVLEHLPDIPKALEKVSLLSSGVVFVRTIFNKGRTKEYARPGFGDNQAEWNYDEYEWEEIFEENGFKVVQRVTGLGLNEGQDLAWIIRKA